MNETHEEWYLDVDGKYYKIVETERFYKAYGIRSNGELQEVPSGRIMSEGSYISESKFLQDVMEKKQHQQPKEATGIKNANRLVIPTCH